MKKNPLQTLFICATHGDEQFSIPVMENIERKYSKNKYNYDWIIGNPKALKKEVRFIDVDLNRNAPGSLSSHLYEEHRAAEIVNIAGNFDIVIDIHGAKSDCGICTIVSKPSLENLLLATQLNCENNVIWNSISSRKIGPLNQHIGKPSIELECGPKDSRIIADKLYRIISDYLEKKNSLILPNNKHKWFTVSSKLNKTDHDNKVQTIDFKQYQSEFGTITPFLSQNTYSDGTFYSLTEIKFDKIFEK